MDISNAVDSHCHITDSPHCYEYISGMKTGHFCAMSTRDNDLQIVETLSKKSNRVVPFYGITYAMRF